MNDSVFNIDFTRALPAPLRNDEKMLALGKSIALELQENIRLARLSIIFPRIDELNDTLLDILAYDLHIDWYDCDSPIDLKRAIIKQSVKVHKRMGTKPAVESVIRAYFGSGEVKEWHEYGGKPHHFRILSSNPGLTNERYNDFFRILSSVKRLSSWLDTIQIVLTGEMSLYFGILPRDITRESHYMGQVELLDLYITSYTGQLLKERTRKAYIMGKQENIPLSFGKATYERTRQTHAFVDGHFTAAHSALVYERATEQHSIREV